jgi:hypothetical protein
VGGRCALIFNKRTGDIAFVENRDPRSSHHRVRMSLAHQNRSRIARRQHAITAMAKPPHIPQTSGKSGSCGEAAAADAVQGYRLRDLIGAEIRMMPDMIPAIPTPSATRKLRHRRLSQHCSEMSSKHAPQLRLTPLSSSRHGSAAPFHSTRTCLRISTAATAKSG